jgi:hypothetical protein
VGGDSRLRPALGLLLSIALPAAAAGGAAAWLSSPGRTLDLSPEPARNEQSASRTFRSVVAALALQPSAVAGARHRARRRHSPAGTGRRPAVPVRISIPSAGTRGPVERMGVRHGALAVPPPGRAGWFDAGPRPGELGRAVIVSHVDTADGPALFYSLLALPRGSAVGVRDRRGALHRFAVVSRRQVRKSRFPAASVYGDSKRPMLVLITCGGPFSPDTGYRDNVILYARAV